MKTPSPVQSQNGTTGITNWKYSINHKILDGGLGHDLFGDTFTKGNGQNDAFVNKAFSNGDLSQSTVM